MTIISRKQFDLNQVQIDQKLHGASLASFSRRSVAFLIDWIIIFVCTEFIWVLVPLAILLMVVRKKLKSTVTSSSRFIKKNIILVDRRLDGMDVDDRLRKQFKRWMTIYIYAAIYVPMIVFSLFFVGWIIMLFFPEEFHETSTKTSSFLFGLVQPVTDLNNALSLLAKFFGAFLYFSIFTWKWQGQTPGKKLMGIKAVKLNGLPITYWGSIERTTGYTASASLFLIGFFQYFWDNNRQTTHDKITETIVIEC